MTECIQALFPFESIGKREVVGRFDGGSIVSDGGALLLRQVEHRANILGRFALCFTDQRDPLRILALLSGKTDPTQEPLAGKSTLNRLELTFPQAEARQRRYKNSV